MTFSCYAYLAGDGDTCYGYFVSKAGTVITLIPLRTEATIPPDSDANMIGMPAGMVLGFSEADESYALLGTGFDFSSRITSAAIDAGHGCGRPKIFGTAQTEIRNLWRLDTISCISWCH